MKLKKDYLKLSTFLSYSIKMSCIQNLNKVYIGKSKCLFVQYLCYCQRHHDFRFTLKSIIISPFLFTISILDEYRNSLIRNVDVRKALFHHIFITFLSFLFSKRSLILNLHFDLHVSTDCLSIGTKKLNYPEPSIFQSSSHRIAYGT